MRSEGGNAAIEFAMIAPILIVMMIEIMQAGVYAYCQAALDSATETAARKIVVGGLASGATTADGFRTIVLCPALIAGLSCSNVVVNIQTTEMSSRTDPGFMKFVKNDLSGLRPVAKGVGQSVYCPGGPSSYGYMQAYYAMPAFSPTALLVADTFGGRKVHFIRASAAYRNEPFTTTYVGMPTC